MADTKDVKTTPKSLDAKIFAFQTNFLNLFRGKQIDPDAKRKPVNHKLEDKFDFDNKVKTMIGDTIVSMDKKLESKKGGAAELDAKIFNDTYKRQKDTYTTEIKKIEDKLTAHKTALENQFRPQVEKLLEANTFGNFPEVSAKDWKDAAETKEIKEIEDLIKATKIELQKIKDEEDKLDTDPDKAKNRKTLLDNQLKKLKEFEDEFNKQTPEKFAENLFDKITKEKLTVDITDPNDSNQVIKADTVEEMNKALVKAQLLRLHGKDAIWASADPKAKDVTLDELGEVKEGKFRVKNRKTGRFSINIGTAHQSTPMELIATSAYYIFMIGTGVGAIYLLGKSLFGIVDDPIFFIHENGSVGWNSKDEFSPSFFTAFQAKNPGHPMYLTFPTDLRKEYFETMVKEARTRSPILILDLSDKCKAGLIGLPSSDPNFKNKLEEFEALLKRPVDNTARLTAVAPGAKEPEEETTRLHGRGRST